jgi:O-antigen/teichoic acid export membrane protein
MLGKIEFSNITNTIEMFNESRRKSFIMTSLLSILILIGYYMLSFFFSKYSMLENVFLLMLIINVTDVFFGPSGSVVSYAGYEKFNIKAEIFSFLLNLIISYFFVIYIFENSITAVLSGSLISRSFINIYRYNLMKNLILKGNKVLLRTDYFYYILVVVVLVLIRVILF